MVQLNVQKREGGKAKAARKAGFLPAVVYGRKEMATPISIPMKEFEKALHEAGESTVIELQGLGDAKNVLIHEVERDVLTGAPMHADLYAIEKGQKVTVSVPLEFVGTSAAVKDLGGILTKVLHALEVEAEPQNLPHSITVDISKLATLEDQIKVSDLSLPQGAEAQADEGDIVAMISVAQEEPVEAPAMDITQIETSVERGKKEEEAPAEGE